MPHLFDVQAWPWPIVHLINLRVTSDANTSEVQRFHSGMSKQWKMRLSLDGAKQGK